MANSAITEPNQSSPKPGGFETLDRKAGRLSVIILAMNEETKAVDQIAPVLC